MTQPLQKNLKGLLMAPAEAIFSTKQEQLVTQISSEVILNGCLQDESVLEKFCNTYRHWICSSSLNTVSGLDKFPVANYSQGTSESFDKFYLKNSQRKFKCFKGEYLYHCLSWQRYWPNNWGFISNLEDLQSGDAVVVSLPFADLGDRHPEFTAEFLDRCHQLDIPVLIDAAFFGICGGIEFTFDHPAITDICFSLSKTFLVNYLRIGIRFTRVGNDGISIYNDSQYINRMGAALGEKLLRMQSPDDQYAVYRTQQLKFCSQLDLVPSKTVIFGIDYKHKYDQFNRGSLDTNRLCFSRYFESERLPIYVK